MTSSITAPTVDTVELISSETTRLRLKELSRLFSIVFLPVVIIE